MIGCKHFLVSYYCSKSKYEQMLHLRSFKIFCFKIFKNILNKVNFVNFWLQVHIYLNFYENDSIFSATYDCSKWKFCKVGMNMGMMKLFPFLLTFFRQLVLREDIFGRAASLIPYFLYNQVTLCKQLLFQQTSFLFLWWLQLRKCNIEIWTKYVKESFSRVSTFIIHQSYER